MKIKDSFLEILLSFFISIITAIISSYFVEKDSALIIGISAFVIMSLIYIQVRLEKTDKQYKAILNLFNGIMTKGSFKEVFIKHSLISLERINEKGIWSNADDYWELWMNCISASQKSWIVTNYAKVDIVWDLSFSDKVVRVQSDKIHNGQKISRLFIFDTNLEMEKMKEVLEKQVELGTEIRWLIKEDIPNNHTIKKLIKEVGTIDFAIVDDNWVFRAFLNRGRKVERVNAIQNKTLTEKAKILMDELTKLSSEYYK